MRHRTFHLTDHAILRIVYTFIFLIPLNFQIIGANLGIGIQWALFHYQDTTYGTTCSPFTKSLVYALNGTLTGKSAFSELCLFFTAILFILSFVHLLVTRQADLRLPGILTLSGGILVLLSDVLQTGILFSGPAGIYIPVGIPFILVLGYIMYAGIPETADTVPDFSNIEKSPSLLKPEGIVITGKAGLMWNRRVLYYSLAILIILINFSLIIPAMVDSGSGWDFNVYMGAVIKLEEGKDPYLFDYNPYSTIPFHYGYPPHTLALFWMISLFCQLFQSVKFYIAIYAILLIVAGLIVSRTDADTDVFLLSFLLISAFSSTYWNFLTGNIALVYLILLAVVFFLLIRERFIYSAVVMGIFSSFALFPVIFNGVYLTVNRSWKERATFILVSVAVLSLILLATYLITPSLVLSYFKLIAGSQSSIHDPGGSDTPTAFLCIADILNTLHITSPQIFGLVGLLYIGIIIAVAGLFLKNHQDNPVICYSLVFLALFLLMPRIKPYYFAMLIVPLYFLLKYSSLETRTAAIIVFAGYPAVCLLEPAVLVKIFPGIVVQYSQTIALFLIFLFYGLLPITINPDNQSG